VEIVLFLNIRGALQVFDIPFLVTQGGPGNASSTFTIFTINAAFKFNSYGLASAMAIMLMVMIIAFSYLQNLFIRERGIKP
jgi:multiple sugar transport system permease protein